MKLASSRLTTGVACSACGAVVVVRPGLRWTKMQCPKCRAVTDLPSPRRVEPVLEVRPRSELADGPPPERPETAEFEARISILEARLVSLEQELASLRKPRDAEPLPDLQPEIRLEARDQGHFPGVTTDADGANGKKPQPSGLPPGAAHWAAIQMARASQPLGDQPEEELPQVKANGKHSEVAMPQNAGEPEATPGSAPASGVLEPVQIPQIQEEKRPETASSDRMVEKLAEMAPGKIAIRVKEGDTEAILFGEWLGLHFIKAGWTVTTFEARPLPSEEQNLTLAVSGNFPFPKRASTVHSALAMAGFGLDFGIDPASDSPIPTIIVPRRPANETAQATEDAPRGTSTGNVPATDIARTTDSTPDEKSMAPG